MNTPRLRNRHRLFDAPDRKEVWILDDTPRKQPLFKLAAGNDKMAVDFLYRLNAQAV